MIQELLTELQSLETSARIVQERLQVEAWKQLEVNRQRYDEHRADLAEGLPDSYVATPKPMPENKRYLYLTKALYVVSDGRVICSESPGPLFTEAEALAGRSISLPPADFHLAFSGR